MYVLLLCVPCVLACICIVCKMYIHYVMFIVMYRGCYQTILGTTVHISIYMCMFYNVEHIYLYLY